MNATLEKGVPGEGELKPTSIIVVDVGSSDQQRTRAGHGARGEGRQGDGLREHREYNAYLL